MVWNHADVAGMLLMSCIGTDVASGTFPNRHSLPLIAR